jgi:Rps23 Pro-64 3,4-dihydroxylase Tpa1-like proline 4-hydroxylase
MRTIQKRVKLNPLLLAFSSIESQRHRPSDSKHQRAIPVSVRRLRNATMTTPAATQQSRFESLTARLDQLATEYRRNLPFPYIQLDGFLDAETAQRVADAFPPVDAAWIHYLHLNEKKHGLNKRAMLPAAIDQLITDLNSPEFCRFLSELTGIPNLIADDSLEGGGLHQTMRGGFLNVHADFTVHPHHSHWRRRVNLLIYLTPQWKPEYGGALEFWERDMSRCARRIDPLFNRAVIFNTDEDSYHGVPEPLQCPAELSRRSIALYYFTEEAIAPKKIWTNYRARPQDGIKAFGIWLDRQLLATYSTVKSVLGINDRIVSRILQFFFGRK